MFGKLLKHDWISLKRSAFLGQKIGENIVLGFFVLYLGVMFLFVGFAGHKIIEEVLPDSSILEFANKYLLYYLLVDAVIRVMFQKFPGMEIQRYLTLNIKKAQLVKFLCAKSIFSFFNLAPLLLFIPFALIGIQGEVGLGKALLWLFMVLTLIFLNHFISFFISKNFQKKAYLSMATMGVVMISLFLDYKNVFSLASVSLPLFKGLSYNIFPVLFLAFKVSTTAYFVYRFLFKNTYIDQAQFQEQKINSGSFGIFKRFGGDLGELMEMEANLIWRNKRSKTFLTVSIVMLFYPLLFMYNDFLDSTFFLFFIALMLTGAFTINYGQLLISWNSSHFDFLLSKNLKIHTYLKSKFTLLFLSNTILFVFSLAYLFVFPDMFLLLIAMYLYNSGFNIFLYMFFSVSTAKKIDINRKGMMNHEGLGFAHYLLMIPIILLPVLVFTLFNYFGHETIGLLIIAFIGLAGLIFRDYLLSKATDNLLKRKYILNARFKE
jgi:hypothetical protein